MKALLVIGLSFAMVLGSTTDGTNANKKMPSSVPEYQARGLELSLISQKRRYRHNDQFKLEVLLRNISERDIYIFGTLDWGYSAGLVFHIRDTSGKEIQPLLAPDSRTHASPDDTTAFIKLGPDHFLGTNYYAPMKFMNLTKPGRYSIFVEYYPPFSSKDVKLRPFWGRENGTLKSNVIWIEVVR